MKGLKPWLLERFPPINFVSGIMLYVLPKCLSATPWGWRDLAASLIPGLHLFLLRVFDEHKDFESDKIFNPHRVLQRGLISLREICTLGWIAAILEGGLFFSIAPNPFTVYVFALTVIWTLLMWKEFFVEHWLKRNFFWYGFTHLWVTPFLLLTCAGLAGTPIEFMPGLAALGLVTSWIYEVGRKTKAPSEENGDASYSKIWGAKWACAVLIGQGLFIALMGMQIVELLGIRIWTPAVVLTLALALHVASVVKFATNPTPKGRKANEGTSALIGFAVFLIPVVVRFAL